MAVVRQGVSFFGVILSERSESKDLGTDRLHSTPKLRRSFDSGLRPPLRMTVTAGIDQIFSTKISSS